MPEFRHLQVAQVEVARIVQRVSGRGARKAQLLSVSFRNASRLQSATVSVACTSGCAAVSLDDEATYNQ